MIQKSTMLLLTIFLTNCVNHVIRPVQLCDVSFKFSRCRCRLYDLEKLQPKSDAQNFPMTYCEGIFGFRAGDMATELIPKWRIKNYLLKRKK